MSSVLNIYFASCLIFPVQSGILLSDFWFLLTQSIRQLLSQVAGNVNMANGVVRGSLLLLLADCWPPLAFLLMCQAANRLAFPHPSGIFHGVLIGPAN